MIEFSDTTALSLVTLLAYLVRMQWQLSKLSPLSSELRRAELVAKELKHATKAVCDQVADYKRHLLKSSIRFQLPYQPLKINLLNLLVK